MSAVSNFASQIGGYREIATPNTTLCPPDEAIVRKTERAQASFVETIVGRRGGLRSILTEVEAVAPTNATVLISVSWVVCGSSGETRLEAHHFLQDETARYHATCRPLARLNSSRARSDWSAIAD
jgi:hypothetical protein